MFNLNTWVPSVRAPVWDLCVACVHHGLSRNVSCCRCPSHVFVHCQLSFVPFLAAEDNLLSLTAGYTSSDSPVLFNGRVLYTPVPGYTAPPADGEDQCLAYTNTTDGRAEDVMFDVEAGDSDVTVHNFQFLAAEGRENIQLEISVYQGSYMVR